MSSPSFILAHNPEEFILSKIRAISHFPINLMIPGGNTPEKLFNLFSSALSQDEAQNISIYQSDERCVFTDSPLSNWKMVQSSLLQSNSTFKFSHLHQIIQDNKGADNWIESLTAYDEILSNIGTLIHLGIFGIGYDGHTASIFPDSQTINSLSAVELIQKKGEEIFRITVKHKFIIDEIKEVLFFVKGEKKGVIINKIMDEGISSDMPSARIIFRHNLSSLVIDNTCWSVLSKDNKSKFKEK